MSNVRLYVIGMYVFAFALASCSLKQTAGGGIETTNGGLVAGQITLSDGSAARYAKIVARFLQAPKDSVNGSADAKGSFSLQIQGSGTLALSITNSGQGFVTNLSINKTTPANPQNVQLETLHTLKGTMTCDGLPCAGVLHIPSLNKQVTTLADGSFTIPNMPHGAMILHGIASADTTRQASIVIHSDTVVALALSTVKQALIESFDEASPHNSLTLDPSEGAWYFASDTSFASGNSFVTPDCSQGSLSSQWSSCFDSTNAYQGKSFSVRVTFGGTAPVHYELFGVNFWQGKTSTDTTRRWADIHAMDSLSFYGKGSCATDLQFVTKRRVELGEGNHYHASFTLDSTWKRYVVYPANIVISLQGEPKWTSVANQVSGLAFTVQQSCSIALDNIVIYGYWPEELQ